MTRSLMTWCVVTVWIITAACSGAEAPITDGDDALPEGEDVVSGDAGACPGACTRVGEMVCGVDGLMYCPCELEELGIAAADDPQVCVDDCVTRCNTTEPLPLVEMPNVCGEDGKAWDACVMGCHGVVPADDDDICLDACAMECGVGCFLVEQMVCGQDGEMWCPCEKECMGMPTAPTASYCEHEVAATAVTASGCVEYDADDFTEESLEATYDADTGEITVKNIAASLNCCFEEVEPVVMVSGANVMIAYEETYGADGPCDCMCPNDVEFVIAGLPPGTYQISTESGASTEVIAN